MAVLAVIESTAQITASPISMRGRKRSSTVSTSIAGSIWAMAAAVACTLGRPTSAAR